jgi:hypothetical protein
MSSSNISHTTLVHQTIVILGYCFCFAFHAPSLRDARTFASVFVNTLQDLLKETKDGVSVLMYLQTIFPQHWKFFLERVKQGEDVDRRELLDSTVAAQTRMWASHRGQTLSRTVNSMMLHQQALRLLAEQECGGDMPDREFLNEVCVSKFNYVVSCQVYGQHKAKAERQAAEVELLMRAHPAVRIAYIDTVKVSAPDAAGNLSLNDEHYSVLIKADVHARGVKDGFALCLCVGVFVYSYNA